MKWDNLAMNKNDEKYRPRIADKILEEQMETFGGVLIKGPKGCGKTSTAKQKANTVIEFQNEDERENLLSIASFRPSLLLQGEKPILLDEWQDAPKMWGAVRKAIDDDMAIGEYILTGSTSSDVVPPHTGTLRISTMNMDPMSLFESGDSNGEVSLRALFEGNGFDAVSSPLSLDELFFVTARGGWPLSLFGKSDEAKLRVAKELFASTCSRDINRVDGVKRRETIARRILRSYARNICTLATDDTLYGDSHGEEAIAKKTFYEYVEALNKLYIVKDIEAWNPSIRSKDAIRSSPKKNLVDPSLAVAALGIGPKYFLQDLRYFGFLFESLCMRDLRVYSSALGGTLSYYHDRYGLECDAALHLEDGRYALIECKLGANGFEEGAKNLLKMEELIKQRNIDEPATPMPLPTLKIILTGEKYGYKREDGIYIIPIGCLRD